MPSDRVAREVARIDVLCPQQVQYLYCVLRVVGFDYDLIGLVWHDQTGDEVRNRFEKTGLTGADLLFFCRLVAIHPGVIQGKLNFNESRIKTRKVGHKSRLALVKPQGPPDFCLDGNAGDGRAFRLVYQATGGIPERSRFEPAVLQQISAGKYPVRLPQLLDVVAAAEGGCGQPKALKRLQAIIDAFPKGVKTSEDVFAPAETKLETSPKEGQVMNQAEQQFSGAFVGAGLGVVFVDLIEGISATGYVANTLGMHDDDLNQICDGDAGVTPAELSSLLTHAEGQSLAGDVAAHAKRLRDFYEENAPEDTSTLELPPEPVEAPVQEEAEPVEQDQGVEGLHGDVWFEDCVEIDGQVIVLVGDDDMVLAKRIYRVLDVLRSEQKVPSWAAFCEGLGIEYRPHIVDLMEGDLLLNSEKTNALLTALNAQLPTEINIRQLFGYEPLPEIGFEDVGEPDADSTEPNTSEDEVQTEGGDSVDDAIAQEEAALAGSTPVSESEIALFNVANQKAIATYLSALVTSREDLKMVTVLAKIGINSRMYNAQVRKGVMSYSLSQLKSLAAVLDLSFAELVEADVSTIEATAEPKAAEPDIQLAAQNIATLAKKQDVSVWSLLQAVGIKYRPHNAQVAKGKPGYTYTAEQLADIARALNTTVATLKEEVDADVAAERLHSEEGANTDQAEAVATGDDAEDSSDAAPDTAATDVEQNPTRSNYDPGDKQRRKVVVSQLQLLRKHLDLKVNDFVDGVRGAPPRILYGTMRIESYTLDDIVKNFRDACPGLTFDWFLGDNPVSEIVADDSVDVQTDDEAADVVSVEGGVYAGEPVADPIKTEADDAAETDVDQVAETEPEVADSEEVPEESDTVGDEPSVADVAETPAEAEEDVDSAQVAETEPEVDETTFVAAFANRYGPADGISFTDTIASTLANGTHLDWKKIFTALLNAGYVPESTMKWLLLRHMDSPHVTIDWQEQVQQVATPVVVKASTSSTEELAADQSLMQFMGDISALDLYQLWNVLVPDHS